MWMLLLHCTVWGAKIRACLEKFRDVAKKDDMFRRVIDGSTLKDQETVWPILQQLNPNIGPCQIPPDAVMCSAAVPQKKDVTEPQIVALPSPQAKVDRVAGMHLFTRSDSFASSVSATATTPEPTQPSEIVKLPEPSLCKDTCKFRFKCANVVNQISVKVHWNFVSSVQMP